MTWIYKIALLVGLALTTTFLIKINMEWTWEESFRAGSTVTFVAGVLRSGFGIWDILDEEESWSK